MKLSQTKRAVEAREWRVERRQKRRFNILVSDYISIKYQAIYDECCQFYSSLNQMYPEKHDLTKTKEYKRWKNEMTNDESNESGEDNDTEPTTVTTTEPIQDIGEIAAEPTTVTTTEPIQDIGEIAAEPTAVTTTEPVQNILQIAAEGLIPDSPEIRNDIDNIIDDIIMDLQQDDALRAILDNDDFVQPHYMDEDEGIGLNAETELDAIMEPFDYELEVEGFDF